MNEIAEVNKVDNNNNNVATFVIQKYSMESSGQKTNWFQYII